MTLYQELLSELIPLVAKKLEAHSADIGEIHFSDYDTWKKRRNAADDRIKHFFTERYDARFSDKSGAHIVQMAGLRATSTISWAVALANWQRAAETKLAAAAGVVHRDGFNPHGSGPVPIEPREG